MTRTREAIVVGAGLGGIGIAIQLKRLGIEDFEILERNDDLGGTWHVNHYPGLAVDIPSVTYSFSFEPNPHWSRWYAPGAELKKYCEHVAEKYDVRRHMRFDTGVESARWDDDSGEWHVQLADGSTERSTYLIVATGFLSQPKVPDIEGIETFTGKVIHSTEWDHDYDFTGKRAGLIGTGATGVQLIPEVAERAAELTVYQRTAIWVTPKLDFAMPGLARRAFGAVPLTQRAARLWNSTVLEALLAGVVNFRRLRPAVKAAERIGRRHLARSISDPELRRRLTPDYDFGCKRPTFSNSYYPTFNKPHVHLETGGIARVDGDSIITEDGTRTEIDVLVLATGFSLWQTNFPAFEVIGRDGVNLGKHWRNTRFASYQGITVAKFPNYLHLAAPYSYAGLSFFTTIEAQMKHVDRLFGELRRRQATRFEVTESAADAFTDRMQRRIDDSVWTLGDCATSRSYYFNEQGEATLARPTTTWQNHREQETFPLDDYDYA
ncbi:MULTISPECIES: flavin-containing monooxygenase [unclassified Nocardioides]|uniref:flavin-containing monooxygenase n=1 Tax=unclassified Nocardioides TaxID=2615069 RepID=UPI0006F2922C|nr:MULTISPECIES: NAD(P)/FAD-dependent oxidoreductase [unclassified Nocardioides]KQY56919.1 monooxygenase [Nocardioides sp. Root140]KQZ66884.1 monooxygenase [Nocardioides sp. Root151]KRF13041.1 monooxygenase [Nocardioides sp. Soil796]